MEEITRSILDDDPTIYDLLLSKNVGTVADLAMFLDAEQILVDIVGPRAKLWVKRAVNVLKMEGMAWLHDWRTA